MKIEDVVVAEFVKRPNRFQGYVKLNGEEIKVAVPNTGRCKEILVEGTKVILRKGKNPKRITPYDLIAAYKGNKLINIDSPAPNKVVYEALVNKRIPELKEYSIIEREKTYGESRFDFRLTNEDRKLINNLLKKYTPDDLRIVIDKKCAEWLNNPKMCVFLKPHILFEDKFERYLHEDVVIPKRTLKDISYAELDAVIESEKRKNESS